VRGVIVENLVKSYVSREGFKKKRIVEALRGVSFSASSGEIHALLGPNGAGKTTLIKILATLLLPDSGVAYVEGYNVVSQAGDVRRVIGVVLDVSKGFYISLTGFENLMFYAMLKGYTYSDAKRRTREVLELAGLWDMGVHNRPYYTYSLGMRARLSIAKALLTDPSVLLLDEPTLGLDVESAKMVRRLIVDLAKEGRTVLITGHNMFEIEQIATSVSIINGGKIVASGAPQDLKQRLGLLHKVVIRVEGRAREFLSRISKTIEISSAVVEELGGVSRITFYAKASREDVIQTVLEALSLVSAKMVDFVFEEPTLEDAYIAVVSGGHSAERS
jgi:ABC-2 type transport system ATP-binding protein